MQIPTDISKAIYEHFYKAKRIVIISHRNPDADTIGSNLTLRAFLERHGKKVTSACVDIVNNSQFKLIPDNLYQTELNFDEIDLIVCVDAGSKSQVALGNKYPEIFSGRFPLINIDHHASNEYYGNVNLVFPNAASTTLVVYHLLKSWKALITPEMATLLLYGLYYDTGSFMHSNTTDDVYNSAAEMLNLGADFKRIVKEVFHTHSIDKLKLWGQIFNGAQVTGNKIVVSGVTAEDLNKTKTSHADISGAIDYLSMVKDNAFATILSEDGKGNIRGSLRTKENEINLSEIASLLGGGGHKKASGFTIPGKLKKEVYWTIKT